MLFLNVFFLEDAPPSKFVFLFCLSKFGGIGTVYKSSREHGSFPSGKVFSFSEF